MSLKKFSLNSPSTVRFAAAALSGLLLSASFPKMEMAWAAWVAPGLILFSSLGTRGGQAFRIGFVAGFVHFLSSLGWLLNIPFKWHGIPLAPGLAWMALSAYCALYFGLWVWLCWKMLPPVSNPDEFLAIGWLRRLGWALATGAMWTALEFGRGKILTGFPWNFIGASQYKIIPLIQIASLTGIYGVSFLVVWTSVALCGAAVSLTRRPPRQTLWATAGLPLIVVAAVVGFGTAEAVSTSPPAKELKVAFIQPSIPQTLIWDPAWDLARFQDVLDLSEKALAEKPELMLWPESAIMDLTPDVQQSISQLLRRHQAWLVCCALTAKAAADNTKEYFNSALLCGPEGTLESIYNKRHLVIFGEYVPLVKWFPFLNWLTSVGSNITPGEQPVQFEMTNPTARMSVLICFEDMFAEEAREHVKPDTDFLVNLSNDGWFGHVSEQWQQAASSVFRAVENGVPIVRCTNDGLTCWADAHGRIRQIFNVSGNVYAAGFMTAEIPLRTTGVHHQTFYNRYGDWFPWMCAGIGLVSLTLRLRGNVQK